jgi:hypothetical protein
VGANATLWLDWVEIKRLVKLEIKMVHKVGMLSFLLEWFQETQVVQSELNTAQIASQWFA